jgi:phosphate transport system substrate-binding protein
MVRKLHLAFAVALAVAVLAGCGKPGSSGGKTLQVKGSDTMVTLGQSWAQAFMESHPDTQVAVTGGGSGTGFSALINGTCDVAQASREIEPAEVAQLKAKGQTPEQIPVALDAVVVVVNPSNPVSKLTFDQLSDIYTGKITNWSQVGGRSGKIVVLSRDKSSGTHIYFLEHVIRKRNPKGPEEYAPSVLMLQSSKMIESEIAGNKAAIGYFGLGWLTAKQKAVAVAGTAAGPYVMPNAKTAASREYPISRQLYLYTVGQPKGETEAYVDFVLSPEGQKIVAKQDFVPIRQEAK